LGLHISERPIERFGSLVVCLLRILARRSSVILKLTYIFGGIYE
jgi:hypothetical protein